MTAVPAQIPFLPEPLKLRHGPLLVTVEKWSDGEFTASLPCAALSGNGESDTEAIEDLAVTIYDFIIATRKHIKKSGKLNSGPLKNEWDSVSALIDMAGMPE